MATAEPLLTRSFTVAFVANLLHGLSFFLFIHLPSYLTDLGADEAEVGLLIGLTAVAAIAIRPTLGKLMDTRGRMPVILAGGAINIVATLLYLTVTSIGPWLYAVRVIHGFGMGSVFPSLFTYGADVVPLSRRTEGFALFGVSGLLPIALGGVIGDVVLSTSTFDTLFIAAAGFATGGFLISMVLREEAELIGPGERHGGFLRQVWRPALFPVWAVTGAFAIALTGYFTFLRTFVDETGIGSVGLFFACYAGTAIALRLALAWLPQRVGQKKVLFPAFGALIAGFLVIAQAGAGIDIALAGVFCGGGHAYAFPILMDYTVSRASTSGRGSAVSFFTALFDIGVLVGGPALGFVIQTSGYTAMYVSAAVFLAGAVVVFGLWDRSSDTPRQPASTASSPSV